MITLLSIIILISISLIFVQYQPIRYLSDLLMNVYSHPYIYYNINADDTTKQMLKYLQKSHYKWCRIWLPVTCINIIISLISIVLLVALNEPPAEYVQYLITVFTTTVVTPVITYKNFGWTTFFNNITVYHSYKLQLKMITNILELTKSKLIEARDNPASIPDHETQITIEYSNMLIEQSEQYHAILSLLYDDIKEYVK